MAVDAKQMIDGSEINFYNGMFLRNAERKEGAMIGANELKRKMVISVEGDPYLVLDVFFASPSARGASAS